MGPPLNQQRPAYDYSAALSDQQRTHDISRTKTGLLLLIIGILLGPLPYVNFVGGILAIVGAILVIVGRKAFGPTHSRNTIWSIVIYCVGIAIVVVGSVAFFFAVVSASISSASGGTANSTTVAQSLSSSFDILLIGAAVGGAVIGLANILFTYAIQNRRGRVFLWGGYAAGLAVSIVEFMIIAPLISNAASQAFTGTTYNPAPFSALQAQQQVLSLLGFIPAILYATAIYIAWSRIGKGEIPPATGQSIS
jgi:hypothetical protein